MGKSTSKSAYANKRQREENLKDTVAFRAKQWAQIVDSRERSEEARQFRAFRLGRNRAPMPGYPSYFGVVAEAA